MKKIFLIAPIAFLWLASCSKKSETTTASETTETMAAPAETASIERKSAESVDSLTSILLTSLTNKDKNLYISYCFTPEQEEAIASKIQDKAKKKLFQREFGFSLHEEVVYFENIIKYIDKTGIKLNSIEKSIIEVFDYNKSNYTEVTLKEIVIPIIQEGLERDIVYVAVQIDGKWYFTSELSL
jgi:uncharacterized protein YcfL